MSDDFCMVHGYEHMRRDMGNPIARCLACESDAELDHVAADLWRKENPDKSVFACDTAEKERYRDRVRKGELP